MRRINRKSIILTSSIISLIGIIIGAFYMINELRLSPIKDDVLRESILQALELTEYAEDETRPSRGDLKELTTLTPDYEWSDEERVESFKGLNHATELEELRIHYNEVTNLKPLKDLKKLHTLDLGYYSEDDPIRNLIPYENRFKNIKALKNLTALKKLDLSGSVVENFEPLAHLEQLTELYLSNYFFLKEIPSEIGKLNNLEVLVANDSSIKYIDTLHEVDSLKVLSLKGNIVYDYTPISALTSLRGLDITLPDRLGLDGEKNQIDYLESLVHLESLTISLPNLNDFTPLASLKNLRKLHITDAEVAEPEFLSQLPNLEEVYLVDAGIVRLTETWQAKNLKVLSLNTNYIESVTPLRDLTKLEELDLNHNNITSIDSLGSLTELKKLKLEYNHITSLDPLENLTELQYLSLNNNQLINIDPVSNLSKLTKLFLSWNQIEDIDVVKDLQEITSLRVRYNEIHNLKPIETLENLEELLIEANPDQNLDWLDSFINKHEDVKVDILE